LSPIFGLALDAGGKLWIADSGANRIRQVTPDGIIATVAGTDDCGFSGDGGLAAAAQLCGPTGLATDGAGNLFVTDSENNRIRQISPDGTITTVAGSGPKAGDPNDFCAPAGDGGPAVSATLCLPSSIAVDQAGNLFVADTNEYIYMFSWQVVRKISRGGIATVAGIDCLQRGMNGGIWSPAPCFSLADGTTPTKTFLGGPVGLAVDNVGNLLIGNPYQVHTPSGQVLNGPGVMILAVDSADDLFLGGFGKDDIIRELSPDGTIRTVAGSSSGGFSGDGGPATSAKLSEG
jgi:sugar lactone lactonase YvrE